MRFGPLALLLSLLISIGGILLLVALPGPGVDHGIVDRHTGQVLDAPNMLLARALGTGNAASARGMLEQVADARREDQRVVDALAALAAELSPSPIVPLESHPWREAAPSDPAELVAALARFANDEAIGAQTEAMFADGDPNVLAEATPVDRMAATLRARLDSGQRVAAAALLAMAETFDRDGRARARDRWLRRAMACFPDSVAVRLAMAEAFVREGRLCEAAAVTERNTPAPALARAWWQLRADLGAWLGRYADEATALTELLREEFDETRARRLIAVQQAAARMEQAARTALALSAHTRREDDLAAAADAALSAGLTEEGRDVLSSLMQSAADPDPWQRRLAEVELQDLRFDQARHHLEALVQRSHDPLDEQALENLYRRRRLLEPLGTLLLQRWSGAAPAAGSPIEVLHLLVTTSRAEEARALLRHLAAADLQPATWTLLLPWFVDEGIAELATRAEAIAARVEGDDIAAFAATLAQDPRFAPALERLAERFPADDAIFEARVQLCWSRADAQTGLTTALALTAERPRHLDAWRALAARAADAGDADTELRATERIFRLAPADRDNAIQRAFALDATGDHDAAAAAWQSLLANGYEPARRRWFDSLMRAGRVDEIVRRAAYWQQLDAEGLLAVGDELSAAGRSDAARAAFAAILAVDPDHPAALLRMGLLLSWADDPAGALPFLERRFERGDAERAAVGFHLAEALWALGRFDEALRHYQRAVTAFAEDPARDEDTRRMFARSLHRVGRTTEAIAAYEDLLRGDPADQSLHLDLAELLAEAGELQRATTVLEAARPLDADSRRFLRAEAQHLLQLGDPEGARRALRRSIARHATDGGELADLATAEERIGEFGAALDTYQRWSALRGGRPARGGEQRMSDRLATHFGAQGSYRTVGDDTVWESAIYGASTISERTRIQGRAGFGDYRGRSQAVGAGTIDVVTTTPLFDLGVVHRYGSARDQIGGGVRLHPDAAGGRDVGGWVESFWDQPVPGWSLSLRAGLDELWTEPAAAAGLGGRRTGITLAGYRELGERGWLSAEAGYERLRARMAPMPTAEDDRATAMVQLGWRWTDGDIALADPFRVHRVPAGPESPYLGDGPVAIGDLHLATWIGFTADRILGDAILATVLPISDTVDFVYGAARADRRLTSGLGVSIDGMAGTDLRSGSAAWEVAGGLTWRPRRLIEWSGRAGAGDAFGRGNFDGNAVFARFEGVLRW